MAVSDPWRRHGRILMILTVVLVVTSVVLPWFARISDLPADDDHTEELTLWMTGDAIGHAGPGWADPLRLVPWGALLLVAAIAGFWAGLQARRVSGRARGIARAAIWSAVAGFVLTGLAWVGAADGRDTQVVPHVGFVVGVLVLGGWLATGLAMLRLARRPAAA
jgi:FtsH-binding integral membrane protein